MEILEAYDLTRCAHSAAQLAGTDRKTVARYVALREAGADPVVRERRLRSEAAWAHLCAAAPIPASSARPSATGSTPAATARPTTPCGGLCSPALAPARPPAPTSSAAPP